VKLNDSVIMQGVKIGAGAIIQNSVICAGANIGTIYIFCVAYPYPSNVLHYCFFLTF
jgi:NDP-sugar pyrophosphorylase family protein